jgi:hypothetical protein
MHGQPPITDSRAAAFLRSFHVHAGPPGPPGAPASLEASARAAGDLLIRKGEMDGALARALDACIEEGVMGRERAIQASAALALETQRRAMAAVEQANQERVAAARQADLLKREVWSAWKFGVGPMVRGGPCHHCRLDHMVRCCPNIGNGVRVVEPPQPALPLPIQPSYAAALPQPRPPALRAAGGGGFRPYQGTTGAGRGGGGTRLYQSTSGAGQGGGGTRLYPGTGGSGGGGTRLYQPTNGAGQGGGRHGPAPEPAGDDRWDPASPTVRDDHVGRGRERALSPAPCGRNRMGSRSPSPHEHDRVPSPARAHGGGRRLGADRRGPAQRPHQEAGGGSREPARDRPAARSRSFERDRERASSPAPPRASERRHRRPSGFAPPADAERDDVHAPGSVTWLP